MARTPLIAGNWKMNGLRASLTEADRIAEEAQRHDGVEVVLCPPATLVAALAERVGGRVGVGGQDCHAEAKGAFTGSVAAPMLADAGAQWVIVGHSERREGFGETDADVRAKVAAARVAGLRIILCVGEPLAVRDAGEAEGYVLRQVAGSLPEEGVGPDIAIAYEPIWAIGTGRVAAVEDVAAMHSAIRAALGGGGATARILYGGSVNAANARDLLALDDVDGALVGGASLTAEAFVPIIAAAADASRG